MSESQYLAMALQNMQPPPPDAGMGPVGPNLAAMQKMDQDKQAWEAANPGQSYMGHNLSQMGSNLMGAPGRVADAFGNLGKAPGQAMSGLQALAQRFGGAGGSMPPY